VLVLSSQDLFGCACIDLKLIHGHLYKASLFFHYIGPATGKHFWLLRSYFCFSCATFVQIIVALWLLLFFSKFCSGFFSLTLFLIFFVHGFCLQTFVPIFISLLNLFFPNCSFQICYYKFMQIISFLIIICVFNVVLYIFLFSYIVILHIYNGLGLKLFCI